MSDRRSMNEAMKLSDEKLAFIQRDPLTSNTDVNKELPSQLSKASSDSPSKTQNQIHSNVLVPLTTRLQPQTATALKRAYLERKLNGFPHSTQQEIVEDALRLWLENEGYLT